MANIIDLQENEYQTIISELEKMHTDHLKNIADTIVVLKNLVTNEDVFSANLTSKKIVDILDVTSNDVMTLLQQIFNESETGIANMITSMTILDVIEG